MRHIYYIFASLFLIICLSFNCNAQIDTDSAIIEMISVVEVEPKFPGGENARIKFLRDNVKYPKEAQDANIQGAVLVGFVVETDGSITNIQIVRSVHKLLDEEAMRVTKLMPNWEPAIQRGKPVRVKFNMPIRFTLDNGNNIPSKSSKKKSK